ncbi:MAG: glycine betaine ABC transporter substrate-binding protein [Bacillota bacterium]
MKKVLILLFCIVISLAIFVGCTPEDDNTITLSYVDWAEGVAMTHLAAVILEDEFDYEVNLNYAQDVGLVFSSLASGDTDVFLDTWLPLTHATYLDEHEENIEQLGVIYETAKIGLVVPTYMDIDSIDELNDNVDNFTGDYRDIIGIGSGAGIHATTETAIDEYDLDFVQATSSEAAMIATLDSAYENEDWVVITGWAPHWKFASYDLKFLDDPEGVYGAEETIEAYSRAGFEADQPEISEFFGKFEFTNEQLSDIMIVFEEAGANADQKEVARQWWQDNEDVVNSWLE